VFSHAPWDIHPAHLSRFAVRSLQILTAQLFLEAGAPPHHVSALLPRLSLLGPTGTAYALELAQPNGQLSLPFSVPAQVNVFIVVQEY
jgi:hypothetical protein